MLAYSLVLPGWIASFARRWLGEPNVAWCWSYVMSKLVVRNLFIFVHLFLIVRGIQQFYYGSTVLNFTFFLYQFSISNRNERAQRDIKVLYSFSLAAALLLPIKILIEVKDLPTHRDSATLHSGVTD